jgi:transcription elongation factor SPT5
MGLIVGGGYGGGRGGGGGGGGGGRRREDSLVGRSVKIRLGPFKGYRGRVVDATDSTCRIELESQMKVVTGVDLIWLHDLVICLPLVECCKL